jgi:hypothetical protein
MIRLGIALLIIVLLPAPAPGEIKTVSHAVQQVFGGSQSPDDARIAAVAKAKREALEMAGTYIESLTVVRDARVAADEVLAISAGVLRAEVVSQRNFVTGDAFGIEVAVRVDVDTSVLDERVKRLLMDRDYLKQLQNARDREKVLLERIASLERENVRLHDPAGKDERLKEEFHATVRKLSLEQALFARNLAERDFSRTKALYGAGVITESQYREGRTRLQAAEQAVKAAESALRDRE